MESSSWTSCHLHIFNGKKNQDLSKSEELDAELEDRAGKLLRMAGKMYFLLKMWIFHCHVSLLEGIFSKPNIHNNLA